MTSIFFNNLLMSCIYLVNHQKTIYMNKEEIDIERAINNVWETIRCPHCGHGYIPVNEKPGEAEPAPVEEESVECKEFTDELKRKVRDVRIHNLSLSYFLSWASQFQPKPLE